MSSRIYSEYYTCPININLFPFNTRSWNWPTATRVVGMWVKSRGYRKLDATHMTRWFITVLWERKKNTFIIIINVVATETVWLLYFFAFTSATSVHFNLLSTPQSKSQFSTSSYSSVSYYCPMCCAGCILIMFRRNWAIRKRERPRNLPVQLLSIVCYITILTYIKMDIYCVSFPQPPPPSTHGIAKLLWSFLKKPRVILFIAEYQAL